MPFAPAGPQAELAEFRRDVIGRDLVPARSRVAAFERIAGKELDMGANALGFLRVRIGFRRRCAKQQREEQCGRHANELHSQLRDWSLRSHASAWPRIVSMSA